MYSQTEVDQVQAVRERCLCGVLDESSRIAVNVIDDLKFEFAREGRKV